MSTHALESYDDRKSRRKKILKQISLLATVATTFTIVGNSLGNNANAVITKVPSSSSISKTNIKNRGGVVSLGKNFFKLKGSHDNERQDAILYHEIGHRNMHSEEIPSDIKNNIEHNKVYKIAKSYETNNPHATAEEFEADRYAANRTSERAIRKAINNSYKLIRNKKKPGEALKKYNAISSEDMKLRNKALKDNYLRKTGIYKNGK